MNVHIDNYQNTCVIPENAHKQTVDAQNTFFANVCTEKHRFVVVPSTSAGDEE